MNKVGVYRISFGVGKYYVGSSVNLKNRELEHKRRLNKGNSNCVGLQMAYNKYGKEAFVFEVIEYCTEEVLRDREMYWIEYYNSVEDGYNIARDTSIPMLGRKHSEKTKKLMSKKAMGNKGRRGQKLTAEHIEMMRIDRVGKSVGIPKNVGERNAGCKITKEQAVEIYSKKGVVSQSKLAEEYGISQTAVWKIHNKIKWKEIHKNKNRVNE